VADLDAAYVAYWHASRPRAVEAAWHLGQALALVAGDYETRYGAEAAEQVAESHGVSRAQVYRGHAIASAFTRAQAQALRIPLADALILAALLDDEHGRVRRRARRLIAQLPLRKPRTVGECRAVDRCLDKIRGFVDSYR